MKNNENFIDYKTSIILNAIEDGWIVYKKGDYYVFRKRYETETDTNPWQSTTIEWTDTTSPPLGHGNFDVIPTVYRGAYEYSVEGHDKDYYPQTEE